MKTSLLHFKEKKLNYSKFLNKILHKILYLKIFFKKFCLTISFVVVYTFF